MPAHASDSAEDVSRAVVSKKISRGFKESSSALATAGLQAKLQTVLCSSGGCSVVEVQYVTRVSSYYAVWLGFESVVLFRARATQRICLIECGEM